jgi:hypothetical protein
LARRASTPSPLTPPGHVTRYRSRIFDDKRHDPYQPAGKYPEPTRCEQCGAVYHGGRWRWGEAPSAAGSDICPACRRVQDKLPAGWLILEGPFVVSHRTELLGIIRNEAEHERVEHPLNRIMQLDEHGERIEISTTDIHLPQRIGEALKRAHHGELTVQYGKDEYSVRLRWHG